MLELSCPHIDDASLGDCHVAAHDVVLSYPEQAVEVLDDVGLVDYLYHAVMVPLVPVREWKILEVAVDHICR